MHFEQFVDANNYALFAGEMRNDTVIGDPLFTVPYLTASGARRSLCYEIHGQSDANFNLISDQCVSINAHYIAAPGGLNIIDSIGIRAQDEDGVCRDIQVDLDRCDVSAGTGGSLASLSGQMFRQGGIFVRPSNDRVRVSLPNGDSIKLILWVICERGAIDMIRFQIARGINLKPTSHGLLGESIPSGVGIFFRWVGIEGGSNFLRTQNSISTTKHTW